MTERVVARPSAAEAKCCQVPDYPQPVTLAADATTLPSVYRSLQSSSDLDYFHGRPLLYSHVKSRDDPISGRRGDRWSSVSFYMYRLHGVTATPAEGGKN